MESNWYHKLESRVKQAASEVRVVVICETCGMVFCNVDYNTYMLNNRYHNEKKNMRWVALALQHHLEAPDHIILFDNQMPFGKFNVIERYQRTMKITPEHVDYLLQETALAPL